MRLQIVAARGVPLSEDNIRAFFIVGTRKRHKTPSSALNRRRNDRSLFPILFARVHGSVFARRGPQRLSVLSFQRTAARTGGAEHRRRLFLVGVRSVDEHFDCGGILNRCLTRDRGTRDATTANAAPILGIGGAVDRPYSWPPIPDGSCPWGIKAKDRRLRAHGGRDAGKRGHAAIKKV
jgi:hypothetical protein